MPSQARRPSRVSSDRSADRTASVRVAPGGRLRAVARARPGRAAGVLRRRTAAHAVRRGPPHRPHPGHGPPAAPDLRARSATCAQRRPPVRAHAPGAGPRLRLPLVARSCRDIAQPYMEELSSGCTSPSRSAVLDGDEIVYVARVPTKRIMTISIALGSRLPAATTSLGRVLLADLARRPSSTPSSPGPTSQPADRPRPHRTGRAARGHRRGPPAGLGRCSTRSSRTACAARATVRARPPRVRAGGHQRVHPRRPGLPRASSGRSSSAQLLATAAAITASSPASSRRRRTADRRGILAPRPSRRQRENGARRRALRVEGLP